MVTTGGFEPSVLSSSLSGTTKLPRGVTVSITDFDSVGFGSNPSGASKSIYNKILL